MLNWTNFLTEQAEYAYHAARGLLKQVDNGKLEWKPATGKNWMTTGQLLHHIAGACGHTARGFVTNEWQDVSIDPQWQPKSETDFLPPAEAYLPVKSVAEAEQILESDRKVFHEMVKRAGEQKLAEQRSTAPWGGPETNLGCHFLSCIRHLESHKSQLFYYLKLQGLPVNTAQLWGMA